MKAVEGYKKDFYKQECWNIGGDVIEFPSIQKAAKNLSKLTGFSEDVAVESILDDTNCDWIAFDDGSVIRRCY